MADNIKIVKGNIFNSQAQTIVNTVNCVGVMGKGIALVFKLRYPHLYEKYQELCQRQLMDIGKLWLYKEDNNLPWILNFPTKKHWKYPSQYEYIEVGLKKFVTEYQNKGITSIAFPLLGVGNGGLDGNKVIAIMEQYLSQCNIPVEIYIYDSTVSDDLFNLFKLKWTSISQYQMKTELGIQKKQADAINQVLSSNSVNSLISLLEYPGIGFTTMQKCFNIVMEGNIQQKVLSF